MEWNEINAAWGQTALLLSSLASRMGLQFKRYRIVPFGNHSYLECLDDKSKELPLYGSGGIRFFWDNKYVIYAIEWTLFCVLFLCVSDTHKELLGRDRWRNRKKATLGSKLM